jgi:hypothetical protein
MKRSREPKGQRYLNISTLSSKDWPADFTDGQQQSSLQQRSAAVSAAATYSRSTACSPRRPPSCRWRCPNPSSRVGTVWSRNLRARAVASTLWSCARWSACYRRRVRAVVHRGGEG